MGLNVNFIDQGSEFEFTVVHMFNQGSIRHRGVIDGEAFFGKQKVSDNKN